jgi:hypothetical protein
MGWRIPPAIDELLVRAARQIRPLAVLTPTRAADERTRLTAELRAGKAVVPLWTYEPVAHDDLRRALHAAERELSSSAGRLECLYRARLHELSVEAALCAAAGTRDVARLAQERFSPRAPNTAQAASDLCAGWLSESAARGGDADDDESASRLVASDDPDPRSLISRMREAVGRLRLPFSVVAQHSLAPLAATGERAILVAVGRMVCEEDAVRTVLHEVEGHAVPRARALGASAALVRAGTARGTDEQEGRAIVLEERAGMLGRRRRGQLAARHRAVEAMLDGASFREVATTLMRAHGLRAEDAVVIAERVFRGGDGRRPGLGRERVYIESFLRVREHLRAFPEDEEVMAGGQVAIDAIAALRESADGRQ